MFDNILFQVRKLSISRSTSIAIISILLLSACTTMPLVTEYKSFIDHSYSSRDKLAKLYKGEVADLLASEYLLIGYLDVRRNIRKCFTDNTCQTITDEMPSQSDILTEAADKGGDLVVLLEEKEVKERVYKSVCTNTSVSATFVNGVVQTTTICTASRKVPGILESKITRALVWRKDPKRANIDANTASVNKALETLAKKYEQEKKQNNFIETKKPQTKPKRSNQDKSRTVNNKRNVIAGLRQRAENGDKTAQTSLGYRYELGQGIKRDYAKAHLWYKKAADQGYTVAQTNLGNLYYNGYGVKQDHAKALYLYKKAAEQEYTKAQYYLCFMHVYGIGTKKNYQLAYKWCKKASNKGHIDAKVYLANLYFKGRGVKVNIVKGLELLKTAAGEGNAAAQYHYGNHHYEGKLVKRDLGKAQLWISKAAANGNNRAQFIFARMYEYGEGLEQDTEKAIYWYRKAALNGNKKARVWLDRHRQDNS